MVHNATDTVFYWAHPFLLKFWNRCGEKENSRMRLRTHIWLRRRPTGSRKDLDNTTTKPEFSPLEEFYKMPRKKQDWIRNSLSSVTSYLNVFNADDPYFDYKDKEVQSLMNREWIRGSIWVLSYYLGIKVDTFWMYPW